MREGVQRARATSGGEGDDATPGGEIDLDELRRQIAAALQEG